MTTMQDIILLKRDATDPVLAADLTGGEGLEYLLANDFCNPHQLVRDRRKTELRKDFFGLYFGQTNVHMISTTSPSHETLMNIRKVLKD